MSDFFQPNKNNNKHISKKKFKNKGNFDEERKDIQRLNKSFKLRKREIEEEENSWENWEEYLDKDI